MPEWILILISALWTPGWAMIYAIGVEVGNWELYKAGCMVEALDLEPRVMERWLRRGERF